MNFDFELIVELVKSPTLPMEDFSESSAANSRKRSDFSKRKVEEKECFEVILNGEEVILLGSMIKAFPISVTLRMISRHLHHRTETLKRVGHDSKTSSSPFCKLSVEMLSGTGHSLKPSTNLSGFTQTVLQVKGLVVTSSKEGTSSGKHKNLGAHKLEAGNVMNSNVINNLNIGALDKTTPQTPMTRVITSFKISVPSRLFNHVLSKEFFRLRYVKTRPLVKQKNQYRPKLCKTFLNFDGTCFDVLVFTVTWLKSYRIFTNDTVLKPRSGFLIAAKCSLASSRLFLPISSDIEFICVHVYLKGLSVYTTCAYVSLASDISVDKMRVELIQLAFFDTICNLSLVQVNGVFTDNVILKEMLSLTQWDFENKKLDDVVDRLCAALFLTISASVPIVSEFGPHDCPTWFTTQSRSIRNKKK
uniref:Uncharacterized protein n=1 Tax=Glossina palpalis gambiensis TaxID=67801 RepID=A0A1B0BMY8_9MUSC